jgi:hypothetical protein
MSSPNLHVEPNETGERTAGRKAYMDGQRVSVYTYISMEQSNAVQIIVAVIPIVGITMSSVVVFFYLLWHHRRRMLLIKAGQYHKDEFDLLTFSLLAGLLLVGVGTGLTVFFALIRAGYGLLGGIIPLTSGSGFLAFYIIKRGERRP